jgi:DNA replication protein DnaC
MARCPSCSVVLRKPTSSSSTTSASKFSTIVTSQLAPDAWQPVIGDPTLADAILDRLVHNAHRINLKGDSIRRAKSTLTKQPK